MVNYKTKSRASQIENDKKLKAKGKKTKKSANKTQQEKVQQFEIKQSSSRRKRSKQKNKVVDKRIALGKTVKREKGASTTNSVKENGWTPARHPRLPLITPPRYFVNKDGAISSKATGKLKQLTIYTTKSLPSYCLIRFDGANIRFKMEEIMAYTFSDQFDSDRHYITYKDGRPSNHSWNNLIICNDLFTFQQEEIDRLQRLHPGTEYTVVRNVCSSHTFERYLVSDTGNIYSLIRREHFCIRQDKYEYARVHLTSDTNVVVNAYVHCIVMQSFKGPLPKHCRVTHLSSDRSDNSLKNLACVEPTEETHPTREKGQTGAEEQEDEHTEVPLPPVTDETRWKTIGVLPWNGLSFSQYEVSDMGHVRRKDTSQLMKLSCTSTGYACLQIPHDNQAPMTYPENQIVSRLVANAFVDGYNEVHNATVQHLNGDLLDNSAQNLKWISIRRHPKRRNACPVVASLVDDPKVQKEFSSLDEARRELSGGSFTNAVKKCGNPFTKKVNWDGEKKMALIQVFPSKNDEE